MPQYMKAIHDQSLSHIMCSPWVIWTSSTAAEIEVEVRKLFDVARVYEGAPKTKECADLIDAA